jgi:hypothetical protein
MCATNEMFLNSFILRNKLIKVYGHDEERSGIFFYEGSLVFHNVTGHVVVK